MHGRIGLKKMKKNMNGDNTPKCFGHYYKNNRKCENCPKRKYCESMKGIMLNKNV